MMSRSFQCATNLPPFTLMQDFVLALALIFISVKDSELKECKISLLFTKDDSAINQWVEIEKEHIKGKLPDA